MTETLANPPATRGFFGHPRGLATLFFTEMWERFSYYGMRALLVLFMTDAITNGGMDMTVARATAIYGIYTASVYLMALPGGWVADRLLGSQRTVWYGGIVIMLGHFTLAIPTWQAFYLGLVFVVLGTGLLKPNISAVVGDLYPEGGARQDAGFTLFYMGINVGALLGPLVCGTLGESERFGWHWGFGAAGVGMLLGLIQFKLTQKYLGDAGAQPPNRYAGAEAATRTRAAWNGLFVGVAVIAAVVGLGLTGNLKLDPVSLAKWTTYVIVTVALVYFASVFVFGKLTKNEKHRVIVIFVLFVGAAIFWSGFEQAGSSLNLFARDHTDRSILGWEFPATWFQSLNPWFILIFAPFFAALWVKLGTRNLDPSIPMKFALGLIQLGLGFLVMVFAAKIVVTGTTVGVGWLFMAYLLHTTGELCLSPVGLSSVTKLAPQRFVGQMMGTWFLGASLGNVIAGLLAGRFDPESIDQMPNLFMQIVLITVGSGLILMVFTKPIKKLMHGHE